MFKGWVLLVMVCCTCAANAQSLRGKTIYVSPTQPVKLKFGSRVTNYSFIERTGAGLFKIYFSGKKNLLINSYAQHFRTANLSITEGQNTHLFLLEYKENLDASTEETYDFSSTDKLNAETQKLKMVMNNASAREAFGKQTISTMVVPTANTTEANPPANNVQYVELSSETNNASKPETAKTEKPKAETKNAAPPITAVKKTTITEPVGTTTTIDPYEALIHLGDSTAWIAKNLKGSLRWYDSAQKLNPNASYPRKQMAAVKQLLKEDATVARKERSAKFQTAMADYKQADALRVERKFEDAYNSYNKFLSQIDSAKLNEYMSSELYYINQAKDYLARLQPYLPKKVEAPAPVVNDKTKKKKRKKNTP